MSRADSCSRLKLTYIHADITQCQKEATLLHIMKIPKSVLSTCEIISELGSTVIYVTSTAIITFCSGGEPVL